MENWRFCKHGSLEDCILGVVRQARGYQVHVKQGVRAGIETQLHLQQKPSLVSSLLDFLKTYVRVFFNQINLEPHLPAGDVTNYICVHQMFIKKTRIVGVVLVQNGSFSMSTRNEEWNR